jgi:hypothetical protein
MEIYKRRIEARLAQDEACLAQDEARLAQDDSDESAAERESSTSESGFESTYEALAKKIGFMSGPAVKMVPRLSVDREFNTWTEEPCVRTGILEHWSVCVM